ncbi:ATP-binding protein [Paenibacillus macquariensis]|uniref:AAA-like domain-containing protein n=1 Tax=Paenibacillus macquariensis TaxID=948756 RepID=A0ABY1KEJ3_9BACL|nr:ATP-binding protein [Paenibacillus macquariensis]OAB28406.1 hypothetical protein PMSM_24430 [Paenibacillus macquariensis subsp. macquariensis]SIR71571.1 AAA-like domain-containing protein [Paenibacillus macquariensis]
MIPISYIDESRVFDTRGNAYAYYILEGSMYAFVSLQKKISEIKRTNFALMSHIGEYDIFLLAKQLSVEQIGKEISKNSKDPWWQRQVGLTKQYIDKERPFDRVNVLCFPLKKTSNREEGVKPVIKGIWAGVKDFRNKANIFEEKVTLNQSDIDDAYQQSEKLLKSINFRGLRVATLEETEWCLKKGYFRGIGDPGSLIPSPFPVQVITPGKDRVVRPNRSVLMTLTEGKMHEFTKHIEIKHFDNEVSYQSFLPVLNVPTDINDNNPTGREWIYGVLERLKFPIDCAIHVRMESHSTAKLKVEKKNKRAKEQAKEWHSAGSDEDDFFGQSDIPEELLDDLEAIDELRKKFRERQPLAFIKVVFALGANSLDLLNSRIRELKESAEDKELIMIQPTAEMRELFQAFYPFGNEISSNYEMAMDPGVLAAGVPFGVRKLGDPSGFVLGNLLTEKSVFMDPVRPMTVLNRSGAVLISGTLGAGKTFLMKLLMAHLLMWGAYGFTNDPKGDWKRFCEHPKIRPISRIISFTPGSNTLFTPFRLGQTKAQCYDAGLGMMEIILNGKNIEYRNLVIIEALNQMYQTEEWDMHNFYRIMKDIAKNHKNQLDREHAHYMARFINTLPNHGIGRMIFGRDDGKHIFEDKRFVVTITRGLTLPSRGVQRESWNQGESLSVAMMYAILTLGMRYLTSLPNNTLKGLAWEEYWYLKTFDKGIQLYNEALRLSRSEKMVVIMGSQNATDAKMENADEAEDLTGMFGWKFMLRLDSINQVKYALHDLMDMPDERPEDWMETFSEEYCNGKGLVRDPEGNVGEMQVIALDPELIPYLTSTPE